MDQWRFDQARNVAAVTNAAVLAGAPILLVVHYSDDDSWGFFDGAPFQPAEGRVVAMSEAVKLDVSLNEIADLPPGCVARRASKGAPWVQEPDPDV
jgi:hypothetical protein